jgi:uncharacterized repeat protein (TIGR01451 family)
VAVQGNLALVVGSTGNWRTPTDESTSGLTGTMTLSVLDITDPANPVLIGTTLVTDVAFPEGHLGSKVAALPIGGGRFAVSDGVLNGNPVLLLVDTSDTNQLIVTADVVPTLGNDMAVSGNLLYTTSASGLLIYNIGPATSIPFTASVEIPNGTGVAIVPDSFSTPPSQIINGANFTTLVWNESLAFGEADPTITWQSTVTGLAAGEVLPVTSGGSVDFTSQATAGTLTLSPTVVSGAQMVGLTPDTQTVAAGSTATYTVTLFNASANDVNYGLSLSGLPSGWGSLPGSIIVPANGSTTLDLALSTDLFASLGDHAFTIKATGLTGAAQAVQGHLVVAGDAPLVDTNSHGIVATFDPATAILGQDNSVNYTLHLTNTGSVADTYELNVEDAPAGVSVGFSQSQIVVPPGVGNSRDVTVTLSASTVIPSGSFPFSISVTADQVTPVITTIAVATVVVAHNGASVMFEPANGVQPGEIIQMTVTNVGDVTDTFDLSLAGPASPFAALGSDKIILAPGASQVVSITVLPADTAIAGLLQLTAIATSEGNPAVSGHATGTIDVLDSVGLTAAFTPSAKLIPIPGTASFLLMVNNLGTSDDAYTATIIGTTGPVTASLSDSTGQPTQTIPTFRLTGLHSSALLLNTNLTAMGQGTVTVRITSLLRGEITASATATIMANGLPTPTVTVIGGTFPFDGQPHPATGTVKGVNNTDLGAPTLTYTIGNVTSGNPPIAAGTYTVTASFAGNANYLAASNTATVVILPGVANQAPSDITLSHDTVAENQALGTAEGTLSTTDPDAGNTFTYTFVTGAGSDDNVSFTLSMTGQLTTNAAFDFEAKNSFLIRVKSTDQGGLSFEKQFTIHVTNVDEPPLIVLAAGVRKLPLRGKPQAFDPHAKIVDVDTPVINLANATVQVKITANPGKTDKVHLLPARKGDLVIKGKHIFFEGTLIAERIYGKKGGVPLTVHFNGAATQPGVEAVLEKIYYRTKGTAGTTRTLEFSLSGLANGQSSKTTKDVQLG